ncbi:MAG TPA: amidase, partial [Alphaproteobacteria bacterium]|nr:amidase [Alphaproteobacteria bacterium]
MTNLTFASLSEQAAALQRGTVSSQELTRHYLDRIRRLNPRLHAFIDVTEEAALRLADAADQRRAAGLPLHPLNGLPIALKDLCDIEGRVTTGGSAAWKTRKSTCTATIVQRLLAVGMVVLGKTHMVEFAFGGWGTNPICGTPRNPWDAKAHRVPGGSSSGSGVAVAGG